MKWTKEDFKSIGYPIGNAVSMLVGLWIVNLGLNVHSGEIFLWLLGMFGFLLILPIVLFVKSIRHLNRTTERSSSRKAGMILTALFGLCWISLVAASIIKEW